VRPGGALVIADLAADDDPGVAVNQNRLERLRDPSHTRILATTELAELIKACGMRVHAIDTRAVERPLLPWLAQTAAAADVVAEIDAALRTELDGGRPTGFRPRLADREIRFTQRFVSVTAHKPG
jgi:hypothetical protein